MAVQPAAEERVVERRGKCEAVAVDRMDGKLRDEPRMEPVVEGRGDLAMLEEGRVDRLPQRYDVVDFRAGADLELVREKASRLDVSGMRAVAWVVGVARAWVLVKEEILRACAEGFAEVLDGGPDHDEWSVLLVDGREIGRQAQFETLERGRHDEAPAEDVFRLLLEDHERSARLEIVRFEDLGDHLVDSQDHAPSVQVVAESPSSSRECDAADAYSSDTGAGDFGLAINALGQKQEGTQGAHVGDLAKDAQRM